MSIITDTASPSDVYLPSVTINTEELSYETGDSVFGRRRSGAKMAVAAVVASVVIVVVIVVALAAAVLVSARAAGANQSEVRVTSAQFHIGQPEEQSAGPLSAQGAPASAHYRSLVVHHRGIELGLEPLTGTVAVTANQDHLAAMAAELDGLRVGSAAPDFANALADAATSNDVHEFVRLSSSDGAPVFVDVTHPRALGSGDYVLVQDLHGDSTIELQALDSNGVALGTPIVVGPTYQWNTGHGGTDGSSAWASAVSVEQFGLGDLPVPVIRVASANAEFKTVAFTTAGQAPAGPPAAPAEVPVVETVPDEAPAQAELVAAYAAVGVEAKIQAAVAIGGEGCQSAADLATAKTAAGQAATYCFVVSNLGTTHLTDIVISDARLGLINAALPKASGDDPLAPGQQAVYFHHAVVVDRSAADLTVATATATTADGHAVEGVTSPTGVTTPASPPLSAEAGTGDGQPADGPQRADAPPVLAHVATPEDSTEAAPAAAEPTRAPIEPVTELALTGMITEPWVLVIFAMAFIFIGYTAYAAFRRDGAKSDRPSGHDQLDALGFD